MAGSDRSAAPPPTVDWMARLMDEYKILQDKIDKIGGFRFTVKGWSVTLTTAALAAAGAAKIPYYLPPGLVLLVVVFFLLEHEQWERSLRFGRRASEIEDALHRIRTDPSFDFARSLDPKKYECLSQVFQAASLTSSRKLASAASRRSKARCPRVDASGRSEHAGRRARV
jgi:hypothetical protein